MARARRKMPARDSKGRFLKRRRPKRAKKRKTTSRKRTTARKNPPRATSSRTKRKTTRRSARKLPARTAAGRFKKNPRRQTVKKRAASRRTYRRNPPMSPTLKAALTAGLATVADHLLYRFLPAGNVAKFVPAIGKAGLGFMMARKPAYAVSGRILIALAVADGVSMLMSSIMPASVPTVASTTEGYIDLSSVYPSGFPQSRQHAALLPLLQDDQDRIAASFAVADEGQVQHNIM